MFHLMFIIFPTLKTVINIKSDHLSMIYKHIFLEEKKSATVKSTLAQHRLWVLLKKQEEKAADVGIPILLLLMNGNKHQENFHIFPTE